MMKGNLKLTSLANTGKQPHSCPPARRGHIRLNASQNAAFQRSIQKVLWCWSAEECPNGFLTLGVDESSIGVCIQGVSAWEEKHRSEYWLNWKHFQSCFTTSRSNLRLWQNCQHKTRWTFTSHHTDPTIREKIQDSIFSNAAKTVPVSCQWLGNCVIVGLACLPLEFIFHRIGREFL